ncbi:MAG: TlpA family protein disulfide reductase [Planctomycetota bacterium]|nr:TlpA family protein disulfide reductase [Planctomycetota bacterium]
MISRATIAALLVPLVAACNVPRPTNPLEGRPMGTLPIVSLDDPALPVPTLGGKVTLLNFWGTWCPPCRKELPGLVRLARRLAAEPRFQLIAVSVGSGASSDDDLAAETRSFLDARQMPIAAWGFGEPVATAHFSLAYELRGVPATLLIGPDSRIRRVWTGYRSSDEAEMAAEIVGLLKATAMETAAAPVEPQAISPASAP